MRSDRKIGRHVCADVLKDVPCNIGCLFQVFCILPIECFVARQVMNRCLHPPIVWSRITEVRKSTRLVKSRWSELGWDDERWIVMADPLECIMADVNTRAGLPSPNYSNVEFDIEPSAIACEQLTQQEMKTARLPEHNKFRKGALVQIGVHLIQVRKRRHARIDTGDELFASYNHLITEQNRSHSQKKQ